MMAAATQAWTRPSGAICQDGVRFEVPSHVSGRVLASLGPSAMILGDVNKGPWNGAIGRTGALSLATPCVMPL